MTFLRNRPERFRVRPRTARELAIAAGEIVLATAAATAVTALSGCRIEPCPAWPRAVSRIQAIPFSAVSIR